MARRLRAVSAGHVFTAHQMVLLEAKSNLKTMLLYERVNLL